MRHTSPHTLWETALGQLELLVTRPNFDTWLRNTAGLRLDADTLVVGVPSDFALEWLRTRLNAPIGHTVSRVLGRAVSVAFEVLGAQAASAPAASAGADTLGLTHPLSLKPDPSFTFDSFTVVGSNRLAYRAAQRIASQGGKHPPLILYGAPGLGKTHLLHAIAHIAAGAGQGLILLTAEEFVNRYGQSVRDGLPHTFRDAYCQCDLLLLDDLQFLASRPASQEQFLHIFNTLTSSHRRAAITCSAIPSTVSGLSSHLLSRLQAGLALELSCPPTSERLQILHAKATQLPQPIPPSILQLIAQHADSIRQLEGALNRVTAYADLHPDPLTLEAAQAALSPFQSPPDRPSADTILNAVSTHLHLNRSQLCGPSRARDISYARHIAMYLMRESAQRPLAEIGAILGNRDHSTVLSGCRRITNELRSVSQTQTDIRQVEALLRKRSSA